MDYTKAREEKLGSRGQGKAAFLFHSAHPSGLVAGGRPLDRMPIFWKTALTGWVFDWCRAVGLQPGFRGTETHAPEFDSGPITLSGRTSTRCRETDVLGPVARLRDRPANNRRS